jgi:hypothetical protein
MGQMALVVADHWQAAVGGATLAAQIGFKCGFHRRWAPVIASLMRRGTL